MGKSSWFPGLRMFRSTHPVNKHAIVQLILAELREEFENFQSSSKKTRSAGNDPESKSEGKYDTRSIEENYLADGLALQAQAVLDAAVTFEKLELLDFDATMPIDLGALVQLEFPDETSWFFFGPAAGGTEVEWDGTVFTVFTPESPLGQQLLGRSIGDKITSPQAIVREVK
jgi:hypothetical protein